MSPAGMPRGVYEGNFYFALRQFVEEHDLGVVGTGEVGIYTKRVCFTHWIYSSHTFYQK